MKTKHIIITAITLFIGCGLFTACEQEIEFKGKITEPMLVVNGFLTPDSLIKVHLSESHFFTTPSSQFKNIENAEVSILYENGSEEVLRYTTDGYYQGNNTPTPGEKIKIKVLSSGYEQIETSTDIKEKISLTSVEAGNYRVNKSASLMYITNNKYDTIGINHNCFVDVNLKFSDPGGIQNYYRLVLNITEYYSGGTIQTRPAYFYVKDALAGSQMDLLDFEGGIEPYNEFADDLYDGKDFSLRIPINYYSYYESKQQPNPDGMYYNPYSDPEEEEEELIRIELTAKLQSISRDYYLYLKTRSEAEASSDFGGLFSEPIQIYSNVKGGLGILGSYNSSNRTISLNIPEK
ncbi:DUF4249 domain-containing protein [Paludibacter sp. 221]|uniref:DUF4249 domain-containing protein n=1 Tax=Paludibacter sp. 221 TaxID=2302939 RepID=UPI0013D35123|nr:DUF4249 domain-containing protein [Paludibacter sp. 221]